MSTQPLPVYSMTGYATLRVDSLDGMSLTLTVKSVNHRFLDLQLRLPHSAEPLEAPIRRTLKERINRGHVELALQFDRAVRSGVRLNAELLSAYIDSFRAAAETHGLSGEPDLNELLRVPGMMSGDAAAASDDASGSESVLIAKIEDALPALLDQFNQSRAKEGSTLAEELRASMRRLEGLAEEAMQLRMDVRELTFERLHARLVEMLQDVAVSHDRLLSEAALLADRSDVEEELVRLRTHAASFITMLDQGGPVGKRLDFLLQELNREANTLLSKTGGASSQNGLRITDLGLEMKLEIERAREQIQNLE